MPVAKSVHALIPLPHAVYTVPVPLHVDALVRCAARLRVRHEGRRGRVYHAHAANGNPCCAHLGRLRLRLGDARVARRDGTYLQPVGARLHKEGLAEPKGRAAPDRPHILHEFLRVARVRWWHMPEVRGFLRAVNASGGIYRH
eukprot:1880431-Prymnesium_polylepis.2